MQVLPVARGRGDKVTAAPPAHPAVAEDDRPQRSTDLELYGLAKTAPGRDDRLVLGPLMRVVGHVTPPAPVPVGKPAQAKPRRPPRCPVATRPQVRRGRAAPIAPPRLAFDECRRALYLRHASRPSVLFGPDMVPDAAPLGRSPQAHNQSLHCAQHG